MLQKETQLLSGKERLGRYTLLAQFATGGMASVYLARFAGADGFEKIVAIKKIHPHLTQSDHFIKMFVDEARLAAQIHHHNVVQVLELGFSKEEGAHYIAMEYVDGETLVALLRRTGPPWPVAAKIVAEAAAGLHAAHELKDKQGTPMGVVHRDVSPQNIMLSYAGQVKVLDFGVARARGSLHDTRAGTVQGKFAYMAPEQLQNRPTDRRTDIFALGIVLYETSTRYRLFKASSEADTMAKVLHDPIERPSVRVPGYPPALEEIVMRALRRDPDERFQTALEMQEALEALLVEQKEAVLSSTIARLLGKTFRDRIKHKKDLLRSAGKIGEGMPNLEISTSPSLAFSTAGTPKGASVEERGEAQLPRRSTTPLLLLVLLLLVLGVGLYLAVNRDKSSTSTGHAVASPAHPIAAEPKGSSPPPTTMPTSAPVPRMVRIAIKALPKEATIMVDGKRFGNRFEVERKPGPGKLAVRITAPNHQEHRFDAPLDNGGNWVIALRPKGKPAKVSRRWRRRRWRAGTKTGAKVAPVTKTGILPANKKDLVDNPYQK